MTGSLKSIAKQMALKKIEWLLSEVGKNFIKENFPTHKQQLKRLQDSQTRALGPQLKRIMR